MGNMCGGAGGASEEEITMKKRADAEMKKRKKELEREVKILLLGSGESGKSTIFKQIKILRKNGFDDAEVKHFKRNIFGNIATSSARLMRGAITKGVTFSPENAESVQVLSSAKESIALSEDTQEIFKAIAPHMNKVWKEMPLKENFSELKNTLHLDDGFEYFLDNLGRIMDTNYTPTQDDILHLRVKTVGITELEFIVQDLRIKVVDVGGQRTERRKWLHQFENVTAVLFVAALSDFDQVCMEDDVTNRMKESLMLFESIANNPVFAKPAIILFLNKSDIFEKKLESGIKLSEFFPEYNGTTVQDAQKFISNKFHSLVKSKKYVYPHVTCATNTNQIQAVLRTVEDILLKGALTDNGLL